MGKKPTDWAKVIDVAEGVALEVAEQAIAARKRQRGRRRQLKK